MYTTAFATTRAAFSGTRVRPQGANPAVTIDANEWCDSAKGIRFELGHMRPARRPPSLT